MAVTKFLARDLTIGIDVGGSGGSYTVIKGLDSLTHSPSSTDATTTDFDSDGRAEHMVAERSDTWTLAGFKLEDVLTGAGDPGQEAVEALAQATGLTSLAWFEITSPGGNTIEFQASADVTLAGGGNNDAAKWQAVIKVSGPQTFS
jgi:hypothetical protein